MMIGECTVSRRINKSVLAMVLAWLVCAGAHAGEEEGPASLRESIDQVRGGISEVLFGVDVSLFGDVQSVYDDAGKQKLDWGALELNLEGSFSDDLQGAMAIVKDQEGTTMTVGFVDYHTFGGRIAPRGRLWVEKGFHLQLGRFDVPFGNDWQFFASKDSVSFSRPFTTDLVMEGGYNDEGVRVLGNNGSVNFNAYLLHGFNSGRLAGGRLGVTPFSDPFSLQAVGDAGGAEFGFSYFYDADAGWKRNETAWAADAEVRNGDWLGRFEYMVRRKEASVAGETTVASAWHFTQEYGLGETLAWPVALFARYEQGALQPAEIASLPPGSGDARDERIAAGFNADVAGSEVLTWKVEVQQYRAATPSTRGTPGYGRGTQWFTQLVLML